MSNKNEDKRQITNSPRSIPQPALNLPVFGSPGQGMSDHLVNSLLFGGAIEVQRKLEKENEELRSQLRHKDVQLHQKDQFINRLSEINTKQAEELFKLGEKVPHLEEEIERLKEENTKMSKDLEIVNRNFDIMKEQLGQMWDHLMPKEDEKKE